MARRDQERLERQRGTSRPSGKRELIVSKTWLQVAALVVVVGFFVLGLLAYRTYQSDPPIPDRDRVAAAAGRRLLHPRRCGPAPLPVCYVGVRHTVKRVVIEEPEKILFTEVTEPKVPAGPSR